MADAAAEAKLRFLDASAHLYSAIAPATSAQLMLQRHIEIASNARLKSNDASTSSCIACGTILIPSWTSQTNIFDRASSKKAASKPGSKKHREHRLSAVSEKYIRTKCLACHRFNDTPLLGTSTNRRSEMAKATLKATSLSDAKPNLERDSSQFEKSTKASKRRDRARKHKSGLQDLLKKSRAPATPSTGFGLDLLDLMKEG